MAKLDGRTLWVPEASLEAPSITSRVSAVELSRGVGSAGRLEGWVRVTAQQMGERTGPSETSSTLWKESRDEPWPSRSG